MKLHLGCGKVFIPGFVHIDVDDYPHIDYRDSIDRLPMIPDNSVDLIYACHVLEHFPPSETTWVLQEWRRVLVPGGRLRVAVPDFGNIVSRYIEKRNMKEIIGLLFGRQDRLYNIHRTVFDFDSLSKALQDAGFNTPYKYNWRDTEHAHIDDYSQAYLPHMNKETGLLVSLNVEAKK